MVVTFNDLRFFWGGGGLCRHMRRRYLLSRRSSMHIPEVLIFGHPIPEYKRTLLHPTNTAGIYPFLEQTDGVNMQGLGWWRWRGQCLKVWTVIGRHGSRGLSSWAFIGQNKRCEVCSQEYSSTLQVSFKTIR